VADEQGQLRAGELRRLPLPAGQTAPAELRASRGTNVGAGRGRTWSGQVEGGAAGVILDGRGRPLRLPDDDGERRRKLAEWMEATGAAPGGPQ
jgi:hypothetical protein